VKIHRIDVKKCLTERFFWDNRIGTFLSSSPPCLFAVEKGGLRSRRAVCGREGRFAVEKGLFGANGLKQYILCTYTCSKMHTCECGYEGSTKYKLNRHQQSKAHALNMSCPAIADDEGNYCCNTCDFETNHKGHYRTHMLSNRHAKVAKKVQPIQDVSMNNSSSLNMEGVVSMFGMLMKHQEEVMKHQGYVLTKLSNLQSLIKVISYLLTGSSKISLNPFFPYSLGRFPVFDEWMYMTPFSESRLP